MIPALSVYVFDTHMLKIKGENILLACTNDITQTG